LLLQPAVEIPETAWTALLNRAPVCLVTRIDGETVGATDAILTSTLDSADDGVRQFFRRGVAETAVLTTGSGEAFVAAMWPPTALVLVGGGQLSDALVTAAGVLGWTGIVVDSVQGATERCGAASGSDVVVVLSHDLTISGSALQAALASSAGYIGALGSRHTQGARAEWLTSHGVDPTALARINGPAGLDIGANTPGEVAISILAAAIAARAGPPAVVWRIARVRSMRQPGRQSDAMGRAVRRSRGAGCRPRGGGACRGGRGAYPDRVGCTPPRRSAALGGWRPDSG
jgi:xanthine dehydrogenase accessory factor